MKNYSLIKKLGSNLGLITLSSSLIFGAGSQNVFAKGSFLESKLFKSLYGLFSDDDLKEFNTNDFWHQLSVNKDDISEYLKGKNLVFLVKFKKFCDINGDKYYVKDYIKKIIETALKSDAIIKKLDEFFKSEFFKNNLKKIFRESLGNGELKEKIVDHYNDIIVRAQNFGPGYAKFAIGNCYESKTTVYQTVLDILGSNYSDCSKIFSLKSDSDLDSFCSFDKRRLMRIVLEDLNKKYFEDLRVLTGYNSKICEIFNLLSSYNSVLTLTNPKAETRENLSEKIKQRELGFVSCFAQDLCRFNFISKVDMIHAFRTFFSRIKLESSKEYLLFKDLNTSRKPLEAFDNFLSEIAKLNSNFRYIPYENLVEQNH